MGCDSPTRRRILRGLLGSSSVLANEAIEKVIVETWTAIPPREPE
jgi:hypothetical protein